MPHDNGGRRPNNRRHPSFTVQDEIKRNRRLRDTGRIRQARLQARAVFTFALCVTVFLLIAAAVLLTVMRVDTVTVSGNIRYSEEEILNAADINGAVLPFLSEDTLEKKMASACPYINEIELIKTYPSSVEIFISEAEAMYAVDVRGDVFSLDKDLRVIDRVGHSSGLVLLSLPDIQSAVEGSSLVFYDDTVRDMVISMLTSFMPEEKTLDFTYIDISDRFNITAFVGDSVKVEFGDYSYIEEKLKLAKRILDTTEAEFSKRSLIDVSVPSKPSALFDYDGEF